MSKLLINKLFISTRPKGQSDELLQLFSEAGAKMVELPLIHIQPLRLSENEKKVLKNLHDFEWLILTSPNGVRYFFENLKESTGTRNLPETVQIAVIGNKTEKILNEFGFKAAFVNPGNTAEDFSEAFSQKLRNENKKINILLALGQLAGIVIQNSLKDIAMIKRIDLYETVIPGSIDEKILKRIKNDHYEMIIFTSPSGIHNFVKTAGAKYMKNLRAACIGKTTARVIEEHGIEPLVVARKASAKGLVESIIEYYKQN